MFKTILEYLIIITEVAGIVVIIFGFTKSMYMFARNEILMCCKKRGLSHLYAIRNKLGVYLLLGLEIIIASDVLQSILNPSQDNLILLGGIVIIRIAISFFLGREVNDLRKKTKGVK